MGLINDMVYGAVCLVTSPVWGYRLLRTGKWRTDWGARFGRCEIPEDPRPTLLIHAVSVGEINAIRLLVDQLERESNGWRIVISATTDTGVDRATQLFGSRHPVVRYPLDFSWPVRRFLNAVGPNLVALVELEVWPNFVRECSLRDIPVCVVNGRLSARSFSRYKFIARLLRPTFNRLTTAAVQTKDYAARFVALGLPKERVYVLDSMKWDTAQIDDPREVVGADTLAKAMGIDRAKPLIVAGSTAPGEERLLVDSCPPGAQLLIAPRKPEWFDSTAKAVPGIVRRSHCRDIVPRPVDGNRFFLLDTIGELRKAYALADVVVVGRSFLGLFGSDMIEPVALGKPTIVGPFHAAFAEVVEAFKEADAIVVTDKPGEAAAGLLADPVAAEARAERGRKVILTRQGATARHVQLLRKFMPPAN